MSKSKLSSLISTIITAVDSYLESFINHNVESKGVSETKTTAQEEEPTTVEKAVDLVEDIAEAIAPEHISDIVHAVAPLAEELLENVFESDKEEPSSETVTPSDETKN